MIAIFSSQFEIDSENLFNIIGPFNRVEHQSTEWSEGKRGCIGFYIHRDVLSFFHQFKRNPVESDVCQWVERSINEIRTKRKDFCNAYRCTGNVMYAGEYMSKMETVTDEELKSLTDILNNESSLNLSTAGYQRLVNRINKNGPVTFPR